MKTTKSDFRFEPISHGSYRVTYTSPVTGRQWSNIISNMELIDKTKNSDYPKLSRLNFLKWICKLGK